MPDTILDLRQRGLGPVVGDLVRDARTLIGWTQRELAVRAATSQSMIWRIETGRAPRLDIAVVERVLGALGMRGSLAVDSHHLADRRRQRDAVHARLTGVVARRLERSGWRTATEVPVGDGAPRGWIDLLAFRPADRALMIEETKTDLPDMGGLQRSLSFYDALAGDAARRLGWWPVRRVVLVVGLDTQTLADRLADNRELILRAFPGSVPEMARWLRDPAEPPPRGWTIGLADPAGRSAAWLRAAIGNPRRRGPAYEDYADAARQLRRP